MSVAQVMTRVLDTCHPFEGLVAAAEQMLRSGRSCLPVVSTDGRLLVGILTDRDVSMAAARDQTPLEELQVSSAMSVDLVTCGPGDSLSAALERMRRSGVRRLLVVDPDGRLVGLISRDDVARAVVSGRDDIEVPSQAEVCRALAESAQRDPERPMTRRIVS